MSLDVMKLLLKEQLAAGTVTVNFTKVNGETRSMLCTLNPDLIPSAPVTETVDSEPKPARKENPDVQRVWCIDSAGWRSFRWDSVTSYTPHT